MQYICTVQNTYFLNEESSYCLKCISSAQLMVLFLLIQFLYLLKNHHCSFKIYPMHIFKVFWSYSYSILLFSIRISLVFHCFINFHCFFTSLLGVCVAFSLIYLTFDIVNKSWKNYFPNHSLVLNLFIQEEW